MSEFADCFRKVINLADPKANSLMSKDNPPAVKILADWGRNACDKYEQLQAENERLKEALKQTDNNAFAIILTCEQALKGGE